MLFDTLEYNGTERTFAAWGISLDSVRSRRSTPGPDIFTLTIAQAGIAADPIFPYEAAIIVRTNRNSDTGADNSFSGGTIKFQGKRFSNPMKASGKAEGVTYEFRGPWFDLEITQYLQVYKGQTFNYSPGEVVLNTASYPQLSTPGIRFISVGDQIQCILQFVLDSYAALGLSAPFQYVGRDLLAGAINLDTTGNAGAPNQNTDAQANIYNKSVNAGTTIDLSLFKLFLKSEIIRPMSAAHCIEKLLDSSPRTNIAFDYTFTPPKLYVVNIDNLPAASLPLFDGTNHKSLDLQRRDDLVPSAVLIGYRITNTVGGTQVVDYALDKWGSHGYNNASDPNNGPGVIVQTLDLQGFSETFATGTLDCEPLACIGGTQAQKRAWWVSKRGGETEKFADSRVRFQDANVPPAATTILDAKMYYASAGFDSTGAAVAKDQELTAADYAFYTNRIVRGTHHAWMQLPGGIPIKSVKVKVSVAMTFAEYDSQSTAPAAPATNANPDLDIQGNCLRKANSAEHHCNLELTNGVTGNYSTIATFTPGESYILGAGGIAQYLFNMLSVLQYEGEYVKVEANFSNGVSLLNRLNLTSGRVEWSTMNAQIQEIEEDWGRKETRVRIGVSKHLNADQLSAFLNMWRFRRAWYNPAIRADNTVAGSSEVQMPDSVGTANTVHGLENEGQKAITAYSANPAGTTPGTIAGQTNIDPKQIATILGGTTPTAVDPTKPMNVVDHKEISFCDETSAVVFAIALISGFYTKT
jgi:hypothetical protein